MRRWVFVLLLAWNTWGMADEHTAIPPHAHDANQTAKHVQEAIKREEHFAKTQEFLQGDDYNLSEHQVDPRDLENIKVDEPMYDFDMDDVYD